MCGIAGFFRFDGQADDDDAACVGRMTEALAHRGPDGRGLVRCGPAVLGHRRLSIIDLSEAASQPMCNEEGTIWLIFNGEIYNFAELRRRLSGEGHRFRSRADSEVLLHGYEQWGIGKLLERVRGMFAFALWDGRDGKRRMLLVRDRLGIKPLYYWRDKGSLLFASELKALLSSGRVARETDSQSLLRFFQLGSVPEPRTTVRGVLTVPAGAFYEAATEGARLQSYYRLPETSMEWTGEGPPPAGFREAAESTRRALEETLGLHLVSDAPLGVFLSGGVDSSSLAALAARRLPGTLRTVSVLFEEAEYTEAPYIQRMNERLRGRHTEVVVRESDFAREAPGFLAAMDQPSIDGMNSYFVAHAARQAGLKVVLSGLGGDELFFGYRHFRSAFRLGAGWRLFQSLPSGLRGRLAGWAAGVGRIAGKSALRRAAYLGGPAGSGFYLLYRGLFAPREVQDLLGVNGSDAEDPPLPDDAEPSASLLGSLTRLEFANYLKNQLLRDTDVMTMAHSIEARVPFLDHVLVERVLSFPGPWKFGEGVNKPLLVAAMGDDLPRDVWDRPKMGFTFPFEKWLRNRRDEFREMVQSGGLLEKDAVNRFWREFESGTRHWSQIWALVVASRYPW